MPSIRDLKRRIASVKNTQQTTKAMKMVSAAKLKKAQDAIVANRPFARKIDRLIRLVSALPGVEIESSLIEAPGSNSKPKSSRKILLVGVTSDRGLCGGFNSSINKATYNQIKEWKSEYESVDVAFVGKKGSEFFKAKGYQKPVYFSEFGSKVTFLRANDVTKVLIDFYLTGKYDEIYFVYNEFKNAITQKVVTEKFLPVSREQAVQSGKLENLSDAELYLVKPSAKAVMNMLLEKHFATQVFRVLLESQASEHGSRMSAMENATKNAGEMIRKLTLQYNKQRQAGITKELLEIVAGSESQKTA